MWPFQRIADELCSDIVDPTWHVRHGAAVGLRSIMRTHAGAAAVVAPSADGLPTGKAAAGCASWTDASPIWPFRPDSNVIWHASDSTIWYLITYVGMHVIEKKHAALS